MKSIKNMIKLDNKEGITLHTKTYAFLSNYCPQTVNSINSGLKSSKVKRTFHPHCCGCLKKIIEKDNLLENTEGVIHKDLAKLVDAMNDACYPKNSKSPRTPRQSEKQGQRQTQRKRDQEGGALSFLERFLGFSMNH